VKRLSMKSIKQFSPSVRARRVSSPSFTAWAGGLFFDL
jgi:hypothetical protein